MRKVSTTVSDQQVDLSGRNCAKRCDACETSHPRARRAGLVAWGVELAPARHGRIHQLAVAMDNLPEEIQIGNLPVAYL